LLHQGKHDRIRGGNNSERKKERMAILLGEEFGRQDARKVLDYYLRTAQPLEKMK